MSLEHSNVVYQEETWEQVCEEITFLFEHEHGPELRWRPSMVPVLDQKSHSLLSQAGLLHCMIVRNVQTQVLLGYFVTLLTPHPYWKSSTTGRRLYYGVNSLYFVRAPFRHNGIGRTLFMRALQSLTERGVQVVTSGVKTFEDRPYLDYSTLFSSMGWQHLEHMYVKWLEE